MNPTKGYHVPFPLTLLIPVALVFLLSGCGTGPREIRFGEENCAHCSMTISDKRFASELVTVTSKVYVFDAIECMAAFVNREAVAEGQIASIWTMDFDSPGSLIDAAKAFYLRSESIQSPMAMNLAAFTRKEDFLAAHAKMDGELYRWLGVRLLIAKEWGP